jgi:hypothetical protein
MNTNSEISILIATKDRPESLYLLLDSISRSTILPSKLIIVYSGVDITEIVGKFDFRLNIEIMRSEIESQIFQKSKGIESLKDKNGWLLFLDDDVALDGKAIEILINKYINCEKYSQYVGFGLAIKNIKYRTPSLSSKFVLYLFKLYSLKPGAITKSGHPQSYLQQKSSCDVSWLNGISIWRCDVVKEYLDNDLTVDYSSYEDVLFSYKLSKEHKLRFLSDVIVTNQVQTAPQISSTYHFLYGSYLRYYFVDKNKEFSKVSLLIAQILRNVDFIFKQNSESKFCSRFKCSIDIWFSLLKATINGTSGSELIQIKFKNANSI